MHLATGIIEKEAKEEMKEGGAYKEVVTNRMQVERSVWDMARDGESGGGLMLRLRADRC